jgi:threonine aldolase
MRFISAQLEAYLTDDLWRRNAVHANAMAQELAAGLGAIPGARLLHPVEANELFIELPAAVLAGIRGAGHIMPPWGDGEGNAVRLVTAFDTNAAELETFIAAAIALAR